jgi:acetyl-CoA acyltransferase
MGLTAEAVANKYKIDREVQDKFSYESHQKALKAITNGVFENEIVPIKIKSIFLDKNEKRNEKIIIAHYDEGPRKDTTLEKLSKLRPVFAKDGTITAGNSSQTSDGAAFLILMSKKMMLELKLEPIAQLRSYSVAGVEPKYMGIGPVEAVPLALNKAGLTLKDIEQIELNEAFASQSIAVINELNLNKDIVNINGGAIALGHPLGCTGAKLSVQLIHEMKKRKQKYGMVTMCVGTGQGAAGIFEVF